MARSVPHVFGRWIEQAPYLAQCGVMADSPHALRLAALPSRLQHAAVELFRGTMVSHSFIGYRDDSNVENRRSHSPVKVGATTSPLRCHGRCAFGSVCLLVASAGPTAGCCLQPARGRAWPPRSTRRSPAPFSSWRNRCGDSSYALR